MKTIRELLKNPKRRHWQIAQLSVLLVFATGLVFDLTACGHSHNDNVFSTQPLPPVELPYKPDQKLVPSAALHSSDPQPSYYDVYQLKSAEFGADRTHREISARVLIESTGGVEKVEMLGKIRDDGTASLLDIQPNEKGQYRATAEAYCVDQEKCQNIILNFLIKVGSHTLRKQFVSATLASPMQTRPAAGVPAPLPPTVPHAQTEPQTPAAPTTSLAPTLPAPKSPQSPVTPPAPLAPPASGAPVIAPDTNTPAMIPPAMPTGSVEPVAPPSPEVVPTEPATASPVESELEGNPNDPNDEMLGANLDDEYVGAQPSDEIVGKLWDRPEHPETATSAAAAGALTSGQAEAGKRTVEGPAKENSNQPKEKVPPTTLSAPVAPTALAPAQPSTPEIAPPAQQAAPTIQPTRRSNRNDLPIPVPPVPPASPDTSPGTAAGAAPEKPVTTTPEVAKATEVAPAPAQSTAETKLAPFLNLTEGGKATGSYTNGKIIAATPFTFNSEHNVHATEVSRDTHWGSGLLVSFIESASNKMTKWYPDLVVAIGDVALQHGGRIGQHSSHQNGLDIDIPYIGKHGFVSIISHGKVEADFDYSQTWQFFRLVESQKIMDRGVNTTVLNRIFVTQQVKNGFCKWAKENNVLASPRDADIMRRLRPTPLHDNHFHLRLKCSPYYQSCRKQVEPPPGTGCN
jgi:penicillin-insensitive murein endopeptidase